MKNDRHVIFTLNTIGSLESTMVTFVSQNVIDIIRKSSYKHGTET